MGLDRGSELMAEPAEEVLHCARHPQVETTLTCGRCDTPICPRCLVQTPVGARCPTCANVHRLPTVDVKPAVLARGVAAGIIGGALAAGIWGYLVPNVGGLFVIVIGIALGWLVGESVSLSTNRKRGRALQACVFLGMLIAYFGRNIIAGFPLLPTNDIWGYMALIFGALFGAGRLAI